MMFLISLLLSLKIVTAMSLMLLSMFPSSSIVTFSFHRVSYCPVIKWKSCIVSNFISNFLYASPDTMCETNVSQALIHFSIKRGLLLYLCVLLKSGCFLVSFSLSGSSIMLLLSKSSQPLTTLLQKSA